MTEILGEVMSARARTAPGPRSSVVREPAAPRCECGHPIDQRTHGQWAAQCRHCEALGPDPAVTNRAASSPAMLAERVRQVARSLAEQDETACRAELRKLAEEANLLACRDPLLPSPLDNRIMVACERDRTGRAGSS